MSSPLLYSHPQGQEQVPQDEAHERYCDEFVSDLDRRLPVNYGCWIVVFIWCNYLSIFYRTLLYINDVAFVSVPWVIICVRLHHSTLGEVRARGLDPQNLGVTHGRCRVLGRRCAGAGVQRVVGESMRRAKSVSTEGKVVVAWGSHIRFLID
jgi:hypothetical protein